MWKVEYCTSEYELIATMAYDTRCVTCAAAVPMDKRLTETADRNGRPPADRLIIDYFNHIRVATKASQL